MVNKMKKLAIALIIVVVLSVTVAYLLYPQVQSGLGEKPPAQTEYVSITDFANRTLTLPRNISRIVAIGPGMLRLIVYLNAVDLVVGVEKAEKTWGVVGRDYAMAIKEKIEELPEIGPGGPGNPPDPELILSVKPELVIMHTAYLSFYNPDELQMRINATVIVLDYTPATSPDLELFYKAIEILGKALNREERAQQLIAYTRSLLADLSRRVEGLNTTAVKVYVGGVSARGLQPFTATQSPYPPLVWLKTQSISDAYAKTQGLLSLQFETLLKEQPDVIFIDENSLKPVILPDFKKEPSKYLSLKAFREGRVYGLLPYNYYHCNIAVALANSYYIGKVLYPERFADIDPAEKADEIFRVFVGKPIYDLFLKGGYEGYRNISDLFSS